MAVDHPDLPCRFVCKQSGDDSAVQGILDVLETDVADWVMLHRVDRGWCHMVLVMLIEDDAIQGWFKKNVIIHDEKLCEDKDRQKE